MNKFAEIKYGKVANIYDTTREFNEFKKLFTNNSLFIDVTGVEDVEIGYRVDFTSETDFNLIAPAKILPETLEEVKITKIAELKTERDRLEVEPISYKDKLFDYDDKARERMDIAQKALTLTGSPSEMWTCYDNSRIEMTVEDFNQITILVAARSGELHDKYNELKTQVEKAESIAEVNNISFI